MTQIEIKRERTPSGASAFVQACSLPNPGADDGRGRCSPCENKRRGCRLRRNQVEGLAMSGSPKELELRRVAPTGLKQRELPRPDMVTSVIEHNVRPGAEPEYEAWLKRIEAVLSKEVIATIRRNPKTSLP